MGKISDRHSLRCLDLFCGAGGSSLGAAMANVVPAGAVDCWSKATSAYKLNFPGAHVVSKRLERVNLTEFASAVGEIDLILASPECTNHSPAKGKERRSEISRAKAFEVLRFARKFKPRWLVVENVIQMQNWRRFGEWHAKLKKLGYKTRLCQLRADTFGVPQSRKRLFILADRNSEPVEPKKLSGRKPSAKSVLTNRSSEGKLWKFTKLFTKGRAKPTKERARKAMRDIGSNKSFVLVYYGSDGAGGWQPLTKPLRTITTLDRFAFVKPTKSGHVMRMLQPPELLAAMGFPKNYTWPEITRREKIKLIGNAVCPPVMKAVVEALISNVAKKTAPATNAVKRKTTQSRKLVGASR